MGNVAVALETAKQEGDSYYKQGVAASNKKDYATAIQLWEQAAAREREGVPCADPGLQRPQHPDS